MIISDSKTINVEYTTGETLEKFLSNLKQNIEHYTKGLEVTSFELSSAYEDYESEKRARVTIYYRREETSREIQKREQQEAASLKYEQLQYERLKKKFG